MFAGGDFNAGPEKGGSIKRQRSAVFKYGSKPDVNVVLQAHGEEGGGGGTVGDAATDGVEREIGGKEFGGLEGVGVGGGVGDGGGEGVVGGGEHGGELFVERGGGNPVGGNPSVWQ